MAATIIIDRLTGTVGSETETDITSANTRGSTPDSASPGTSNPIPVTAAGTNCSFWFTTRLKCTATPSGTVDNLRWYTDGANGFGTGVTCKSFEAATGANAGYRQATGTAGTTGDQLTTGNHTGLDGTPVDVLPSRRDPRVRSTARSRTRARVGSATTSSTSTRSARRPERGETNG